MDLKIENLISGINRIVEQQVKEFIDERIDILLREMSFKYNITYDDLFSDYKRSCSIKKRKCIMTTTLGHNCKYDAKQNEDMCKKHFNKAQCL